MLTQRLFRSNLTNKIIMFYLLNHIENSVCHLKDYVLVRQKVPTLLVYFLFTIIYDMRLKYNYIRMIGLIPNHSVFGSVLVQFFQFFDLGSVRVSRKF